MALPMALRSSLYLVQWLYKGFFQFNSGLYRMVSGFERSLKSDAREVESQRAPVAKATLKYPMLQMTLPKGAWAP